MFPFSNKNQINSKVRFSFLSHKQKGMTYVELIVVMSIFAIISSISIFNYKNFQDKVDVKNLSADIALRVVKAQKDSVSGYFPPNIEQWVSGVNGDDWKPSYGIYFDDPSVVSSSTSFYSFVDLNQDKQIYSNSSCAFTPVGPSSECLEKINITKGNKITNLTIKYQDGSSAVLTNAHVTFTRPNSGATFQSIVSNANIIISQVNYLQISIANASSSVTSIIKIYASGRVEVI